MNATRKAQRPANRAGARVVFRAPLTAAIPEAGVPDARKNGKQLHSAPVRSRAAHSDKQRGQIDKQRGQIQELRESLLLEQEELQAEQNAVVEAKRELAASHDRYTDLFDFAPIGYATLDRNGTIIKANPTIARLLGYTHGQMVGFSLMMFVAKPDRPAFVRHLTAARATTSTETTAELRFIRKDGQPLLLHIASIRSHEAFPHRFRIRAAIRDITEQRRADEARRHLAAIVEYSEDAIVSKTLDGVITSWNRGAKRLFGYSAEEVIGKPITVLIPQERLGEEVEILEQIRRGQPVEHYETIRRRKDGSEVPVSLTISPVKDDAGQVIGASKIARDISRRKQAEEALRRAHDALEQRVRERTAELTQANDALRESEARLQGILEHSPEMIFLKDTEGRYLVYNRRFAEAFHLSAAQAIGKTDYEIFPHVQAEAFRANDLKVLETGKPFQFLEVATHDDGRHSSLVSKYPIRDAQGKIYAVGGIVTDITERKRLEKEVLRISEREQERIAQDLHDGLGQQLAGTWFLSDTLRKNLEAQASPQLPTASKLVQLLETALNQTRTLARGLSPVSPQPNGLMAALEELARQTADLFGVKCCLVCPDAVLLNDNNTATHLYRITQEAINNSLKHGRARRIEIGLFARKGGVRLSVLDDGVGFKKAPNEYRGMGLRTMKYRADLIGADFAIRSRGIRGTKVMCDVQAQLSTSAHGKTHHKENGR